MDNLTYYVKVDESDNLVNNSMYTARAIAAELQVDFDESFVIPNNYKEIIFETANDVVMTKYQRLSDEISISKENGKWYKKAIVVDGDDAYRAYIDGELHMRASMERNMKLYESDWTQLQDVQLSTEKQNEWKAYRQALRDITTDPAFPIRHQWPVKPQ